MSDRTTTASTCVAALLALGLSAPAGDGQSKPGPPPPPVALGLLWQRVLTLPQESTQAPRLTAGDSLVFVNSAEMGLKAMAPEDGHEVWSSTYVSPLAAVTVGSRIGVVSRGVLYVLEQQTSVVAWQVEVPGTASALFVCGDRVGAVILNEILSWSGPGAPVRTPLGSAAATRVVCQNDILYVGLAEPSLVAIDATTGAVRWRLPLPAVAQALAVRDDLLYVGAADSSIYLYRTSGEAAFVKRRRLVLTSGDPVVDERFVYFTFLDNSVRAFDRKGGTERWSRELGARPKSGPILLGETVAVALETGNLVELTARDGHVLTPAAPPKLTEARLQAVAATRDRGWFFTMATAKDEARILTAWGHPPPKRPQP